MDTEKHVSPQRYDGGLPQSMGNTFTINPASAMGQGPPPVSMGDGGAYPPVSALLHNPPPPHHGGGSGYSPHRHQGPGPLAPDPGYAAPPPAAYTLSPRTASPRDFNSIVPAPFADAGGEPGTIKISPRRKPNVNTRPVPALEMDNTADENYRHKVAQSHGALDAADAWRPNEWMIRRAEDRLAEADKRVRLLHSEAEQLDKLKRQQMAVGEEELLRLKRKLLDDWEQRERNWERRREEELRNIKLKEGLVDEQHQRLKEIEQQQQEQMRQAEEEQRERMRMIDQQNTEMLRETELRLRRQLFNDPDLRREIEDDVTCRVAQEVREELQIEFSRLCETMRTEVQAARDRMRTELERELVPAIEQSLYLDLKARTEQEVHQRVLKQLREANQATQLLKDELQNAVTDKQRAEGEAGALRKELGALDTQLRQATTERDNAMGVKDELDRTRAALTSLQKEHELLRNAADVMLASAKQQQALQQQLQQQLADTQQQLADAQNRLRGEEGVREISPRRWQNAGAGQPPPAHMAYQYPTQQHLPYPPVDGSYSPARPTSASHNSPFRQYASDRPASTVQGAHDRDSPRDLSPTRGLMLNAGGRGGGYAPQQGGVHDPSRQYPQSQLLPGGGVVL